jgi:purine-nucleoside phosphorylase
MMDDIRAAAGFLEGRLARPPRIGLITGTGLGGVTATMSVDARIPYDEIPHFPTSTIEGHKGTLVCGALSGVPALAMEGRFHLYEGYSPQQVGLPVRVMARLGVTHLFVSSAAGGLDPRFSPGDLMLVIDHINLTGTNPLTGANLDAFGPRFPDMSRVYDPDLARLVRRGALAEGIELKQGVYVGIPGPSLETPAETRFLRMIGADAVGMSTVTEIITGIHCGLRIAAVVAVTNVNRPDCMEETSLQAVIAAAERAGPGLTRIWERTAACLK